MGPEDAVPITKIVDALNRIEAQVDLYEIVSDAEDGVSAIVLVRHSLPKSKERRRDEALRIVRRKFPTAMDVVLHKYDDWKIPR